MKMEYKTGIIFAPWVNVPYRGKWLSMLDNLILRIPIPIIYKWYLKWLIKQPQKIMIGKYEKYSINKYKSKTINPKYYKQLYLPHQEELRNARK